MGCAGGLTACVDDTYEPVPEPEGYSCYSFAVKGFKGGHSGMDIILCRGNANKLAARLLYKAVSEFGVKLIDMEGGTLQNDIPRECFATVYVPAGKETELTCALEA